MNFELLGYLLEEKQSDEYGDAGKSINKNNERVDIFDL